MISLTLSTTNLLQRFLRTLARSATLWERPLQAILFSAVIYTGISLTAGSPFNYSDSPYFNLLADAFLHGQLHLRVLPPRPTDLSLFNGQYYLYWGPLPAVMAMPLVALFGPHVSDIIQSLFYGPLVVGLLAAVLRAATKRDVIQLSPLQRALLVLTFALGSPYMPITETGHVWLLGLIIALLFGFLAFWTAFTLEGGKAFFWSGCAVAALLLTRLSAIFMVIFVAWYLIRHHWNVGLPRLARYCALALLPVILALALLGVYNYARFGSPFDNGLAYHLMSPFFTEDFKNYGVFNVHFIPGNIYYNYLYYPYQWAPTFDVRNKNGSLFLLTPVFFLAFYALWQDRKNWDTWVLFGSILLSNIPILLLMGPGSENFGARYTLDFFMPLFLLTALGMRRVPIRYVTLLLLISLIHFIIGGVIYVHFMSV